MANDDTERKAARLMIGGAIMTQAAVCRFLIDKGLIDRSELVSYVAGKKMLWERSGGPDAGGAAQIFLTAIHTEAEPEFPLSTRH